MRRLLVLAASLLGLLVLASPVTAAPATSAPVTSIEDDDAIVVLNGDVRVGPGEVESGVFIVHGSARIAGTVDGDVVVASGDVIVRGQITGHLVTLGGQAILLPGSRVEGDLLYGDEPPFIAQTATVGGTIEKKGWPDSFGILPFLGALLFWLAMTASMAVLGALLLVLAPRAADAVFAQAETRFWTAVGIGVGAFLVLPLAALVAAITLVGLPLAVVLGLALLPLAGIAYVASAWTLGRFILKPPRNRFLAFFAGLAILRVLALVPVLGGLVWLLAVLAGLGLIAAAITAARAPAAAGAPGN